MSTNARLLWPLDEKLPDDLIFDQDFARPWLVTIWEPLRTKAPGPHLTLAYCCYINTVIFYCRPYVVRPYVELCQDSHGKWYENRPRGMSYEQWDQIESFFDWDDKLAFNGEVFIVGGGTVMWTNEPDHGRRRWWMKRWARREANAAAA